MGGRWSAHRPPSGALPPGARRRLRAPDVLGHLVHHIQLQRPEELRMMVSEVLLHRIEQLLLGAAGELRPALADRRSDGVSSIDRHALAVAAPASPRAPRRGCRWWTPVHAREDRQSPLSIRFQIVAVSQVQRREHPDPALRTLVRGDRRRPARGAAARQAGPLLLAYLLLNRSRHVGREELIGALWPEHTPASQDAALRTLLSRLRSGLGGSALAGRDELILDLPEPVWIDLEAASSELQRAMQALDRGDARTAWALAQVPLNIASRGLLPGSAGALARAAAARARGHPAAGARGDRARRPAPRRRRSSRPWSAPRAR